MSPIRSTSVMKCASTSGDTVSMQTIRLSRFGFQFAGACSTRS